ncbi:TIGR01244 family sulfur transferase [Pseudochelatococcus contaminans]|uniref:Uncharacterized protein (TIGR01244 family) n=1 Tax=Pseudochelatococcus contaminans TaxID=1538103 RepID=A0A7W6EIH6_9HYPH|nr:uncharacterized protein (TIGR01244 family) [Pseudochelatococcus contaminans]
MNPVVINERFAVCGQIRPKDIADIARAGYAAIINNRPDGEVFLQPSAAAISAATQGAAMESVNIPIAGPDITEAKVRMLQKVLAESRGPVLAFCRSGSRSLILWAIGEVFDGRMRKKDLVPFGNARGFDLSRAVGWLTENGY